MEKNETGIAVEPSDFISVTGTRYGDVLVRPEESLGESAAPETELYVTGAYDQFMFPVFDGLTCAAEDSAKTHDARRGIAEID